MDTFLSIGKAPSTFGEIIQGCNLDLVEKQKYQELIGHPRDAIKNGCVKNIGNISTESTFMNQNRNQKQFLKDVNETY